MQLIYQGMFDAVEVPEAGIMAKRGEPVEVPDGIGARLLLAGTEITEDGISTRPEQPDWAVPVPAAKTGKEG